MNGGSTAVLVALLVGTAGLVGDFASASSDRAAVAIAQASPETAPARYTPWAIELEVGATPIAAYQVELVVRGGDATIVGVEGGTADGFRDPPYYDPRALAGGRIVLAAFNTERSLAPGRHRVALLHLREAGPDPAYELRLVAASAPDGSPAAAEVHLLSVKGEPR